MERCLVVEIFSRTSQEWCADVVWDITRGSTMIISITTCKQASSHVRHLASTNEKSIRVIPSNDRLLYVRLINQGSYCDSVPMTRRDRSFAMKSYPEPSEHRPSPPLGLCRCNAAMKFYF
jgi:hypothetical protein